MRRILLFMPIFIKISTLLYAQSGFTKVVDTNNPVTTYTPGNLYRGASWIDVDNDHDIDLFVSPNKLFYNHGQGNFTQVLTNFQFDESVTPPILRAAGNTWGDLDNDGDLDCFQASMASQVYLNNGNGEFTALPVQAQALRSWGAAFGDYNNDGWLDLIAVNPFSQEPNPRKSFFFINDGSGKLNLGPVNYDFSTISAPYTTPYWSDFDLDGDVDLFLASGPAISSSGPDFHFKNLKKETGKDTLVRITNLAFATDAQDGQCYNFVDYDNDGDLDICLTNYANAPSRLYRNDGGSYTSITTPFTQAKPNLANCWGDFDNDGDLDLLIASDSFAPEYYQNNGNGTFTLRNVGLATNLSTTCIVGGDYDNDGDLDIHIQGNATGRALYNNTSLAGTNNWVSIKCTGTSSNRAAIGTKVRLKATINGKVVWQIREISAQNSFQGQNDLRVHFGLGNATHIDSLVIDYLGGTHDVFTNLMTNQFYKTSEGQNDLQILTSENKIGYKQMSAFKMSPNPASQYVLLEQISALETNQGICSIFDLTGKIITQQIITDSVGQQVRLELNQLSPGHFLVSIKVGSQQQVFKLVRQ